MFGILKKVFGTKHDRDVKAMLPIVEQINAVYATLSGLSDDDLRAKSDALRGRIAEAKKEHEATREELRAELLKDSITHDERLDIYKSIEDSEKAEYGAVADLLDEMLPEAFALVKEVARRLTERKHSYQVSGHTQTWAMVPYDVQLMGGIVLHSGKIAEMATGEGKTLVGVAPMYLNALTGYGVHLVTVNDYLARRDSEWMKVGAWVYDNMDICSGISFLPHDDHIYQQAPYQDTDEEGYKALLKEMPTSIDWSALALYEQEDNTSGSQTFACAAGACEIVDLTKK